MTDGRPATGGARTGAARAPAFDRSGILKGALVSGAINAVINGAIQVFLLRGQGPVAVSADSIAGGGHTLFAAAVPLAVSLAMILTAVAHLTLKAPKKPFFPSALWLVVKHGLFAFGAVVTLAVLWQRFVGTVEVGVAAAVVVLALVAGVVATAVNYMTISAVVDDAA